MPHYPRLLFAALLAACPLVALAHSAGSEMAAAARSWLAALEPGQRERAVFPLTSEEREDWHFIPRDRPGLPLRDQTPAQQDRARALVAAGLSQRGVLQVDAIIALEEVLRAMGGSTRRNPLLYYFSVFGEPGDTAPWGWRLEGHHLSVNFTVVAGRLISATPIFFGSNPAEVRIEHPQKGRRALAGEEDLARAFMLSLDASQRTIARIASEAPQDIITANDRQARLGKPEGIPYGQLTTGQQAGLKELVRFYADRLRPDLADGEMEKIAARGWEQVHFAWAGGVEPNQAHYYRIHGAHFVIEYDKTQDAVNHIHTVWRDFAGDFGRDLLREHYQGSHPTPATKPSP